MWRRAMSAGAALTVAPAPLSFASVAAAAPRTIDVSFSPSAPEPLSSGWPNGSALIFLLLLVLALLLLAGPLWRTLRTRRDRKWFKQHVAVVGAAASTACTLDEMWSPERPRTGWAFVAVRRLTTIHLEDPS